MHGDLKKMLKIWIFPIRLIKFFIINTEDSNVNIKIPGFDARIKHIGLSFEYVFFLCLNEMTVLKKQHSCCFLDLIRDSCKCCIITSDSSDSW